MKNEIKFSHTNSVIHREVEANPCIDEKTKERCIELRFTYNNHTNVIVVDLASAMYLADNIQNIIEEVVHKR